MVKFKSINLIFEVMNTGVFYISINLPNGQVLNKCVIASSAFAAVDLLFWRDGYHKIQPDRSQYIFNVR